jgi:hypothetical protein
MQKRVSSDGVSWGFSEVFRIPPKRRKAARKSLLKTLSYVKMVP